MRHLVYEMGFVLATACGTSSLDGPADAATAVRERLADMVESELPGAQYVVVNEASVVFEAALGVRDVKSKEPMERDTIQMAYSMTKAITAVAVMKLAGEGKIELDRPLGAYFAAHPYGETVTIRSLLAQTSGVPNPMPLDWFSVEGAPLDRDEKLQAALEKNPKLDHTPGAEYGYSNLSYWLLEKAIEEASGLDYAEYVEEHVLAPLSIPPEDLSFSPAPPERSATGHSRRYSVMNLIAHFMSPSAYWRDPSGSWSRTARVVPHGRGYGGAFANASALAQLLQDLLRSEPTLLSSAGKEQMFTQQKTSDGDLIDMTLGWVVGDLDGVRYFGKQGGGLGFHGNLRIYPERGLATVLLSNRTELSAGPIDARSDALDEVFVTAL